MIAKFDGRCAKCGESIRKGDEMVYENRKAWHPACFHDEAPAEIRAETPEQLAERLGFKDAK